MLMRDGTEAEAKFTLGHVIGRTASRFPHQPAIVSATFPRLTYHDLQRCRCGNDEPTDS